MRTPVAVDKEPESYDLTVVNLDRRGQPADDYTMGVFLLDQVGAGRSAHDPSGTVKLRLPKGGGTRSRRRSAGDGGLAQLSHPKGHGFVSLRASAADRSGNTVEQTIIKAYRY